MLWLPFSEEISIVLGGEAGQGIQTIEQLLTKILKQDGYHVYAVKEYMSRIRGGSNSTAIRVASQAVQAPVQRIDLLIALDKDVIAHMLDRISKRTVIVGDREALGELEPDMGIIDIPFQRLAREVGGKMFVNTIALGLIPGLLQIDKEVMEECLMRRFSAKGEEMVDKNIRAAHVGYEKGEELGRSDTVELPQINRSDIQDQIMLNGSEAVAMGAIAGGCRCVTSYPMTPGTGVITQMAGWAHDFDLLVEQAEDEIAAINMALGAWYAGTRAMVTTSGGGFALMTEGVSLAAMLELPMVIHLAQRPGPATGLPTRTEQADLELALHAGHGEFPRIILAPDSLESAFRLTRRAFNLADKYQVPVIILTDQYLVDTYYNTDAFDLEEGPENEQHIMATDENYQRYRFTDSGISPRGIPGGPGLVGVDSDEHDEAGHITEDLEMRVKMVNKRLKKLARVNQDSIPFSRSGPENSKNLILSWGSNNLIVKEAVKRLDRDDVEHVGIQRVYPLPAELPQMLDKAERTIIVENNATSQMGKLIRRETGHHVNHSILKYNGLPFTVEETARAASEYLAL